MADNAKALVERLESRMDDAIASQQKSQKLTIGIGAVLVIIMIVYFSVLTHYVKDIIQPDSVADLVMAQAEQAIPRVSDQIKKEIIGNADKLMEQSVATVLEKTPEYRKELETFVDVKTKYYLKQVEIGIREITDVYYEQHGDDVRAMLMDLSDDDSARVVEEDLYHALMGPIEEVGAVHDIEAMGLALHDLNDKLVILLENDDLSKEQRIHRDIIIALREFSVRSDSPVGK